MDDDLELTVFMVALVTGWTVPEAEKFVARVRQLKLTISDPVERVRTACVDLGHEPDFFHDCMQSAAITEAA